MNVDETNLQLVSSCAATLVHFHGSCSFLYPNNLTLKNFQHLIPSSVADADLSQNIDRKQGTSLPFSGILMI